ncbi:HupE/UreJ family protein [Mesorhizobium sp. Cs1321R2N1]|uniref:HupE/UreJ family protein n=1 Tax=Mesorhizobium sp. Cs1321R2N1 TaxID=3015174 RepID=UPI00301CD31B
MAHIIIIVIMLIAACVPAFSHVGGFEPCSFAAGLVHPLSGLDHIMVMVAVGLWAALKGGRALWAWPATFVGFMVAGGTLGVAAIPVPLVEPVILISIVAFGLLVSAAVDVPTAAGAAIIAFFAFFHGHAHGTEIPETAGGFEYLAGFAVATVLLHGGGIGLGLLPSRLFRRFLRLAGGASAAAVLGLMLGWV